MWDRFYDHYVQEPMQKIVTDRLRPAGANDGYGVEQATPQLRKAYALLERELGAKTWTMDEASRSPTARPHLRSSTPTRWFRSASRTAGLRPISAA